MFPLLFFNYFSQLDLISTILLHKHLPYNVSQVNLEYLKNYLFFMYKKNIFNISQIPWKKGASYMENNDYQIPKDGKVLYFSGKKLSQSNTFN